MDSFESVRHVVSVAHQVKQSTKIDMPHWNNQTSQDLEAVERKAQEFLTKST